MKQPYPTNTLSLCGRNLMVIALGVLFLLGFNTTQVTAQLNAGIYDSYLSIGGTNTYFLGTSSSPVPCPGTLIANSQTKTAFSGANLGTFAAGGTLTFSGGAMYGWKNGSGNMCSGTISYRIYSGSPGSYLTLPTNLGFGSNNPVTCASYTTQLWTIGSNTVNILNGLAVGSYSIDVFMSATGSTSSGSGCTAAAFQTTALTATFTVANLPVITSVVAPVLLNGQATNTGYKGQTININGSNLAGTTAASFGGTAVASITSSAASQDVVVVGAGTSGNTSVTTGAGSNTFGGFTYLGFISNAATDWNTGSTWLGGTIPTAAAASTVIHAVSVNTVMTNTPSSLTIGTGGNVTLGVANAIPSGVNVTLRGGTLTSSGFSDNIINGANGTLAMTASSTIALGAGAHQIKFATSSALTWTGTLTITGWTGTAGVSGTAGQVFFGTATGTLTSTQLSQVTFSGYSAGAILLGTGELVPTNVAPNAGIYDSYISIGAANAYYMGTNGTLVPCSGTLLANGLGKPAFNGANLGTFGTGGTLTLSGGSQYVWKGNSNGNICSGVISYRIYSGAPPAYSTLTLNFNATNPHTCASYTTQMWNQTGSSVNILNALPVGSYTMDVFLTTTGSTTTGCATNFVTSVYTATFTVANLPAISSVVAPVLLNSQATNTGYKGQTININGSNLAGTTAASFGGTAVASITSSSASQDVVVVGNGTSGTTSITNPSGTATFNGFTYLGSITTAAGDWNTGATWLGGSVPAAGEATTVIHAVTVNSVTANTPASINIGTNGTLTLGVTNAIPSGVNMTLSGGNISTGSSTGFSDQVGTLTVSSNATITLGTGSHQLRFTNSTAIGWSNCGYLTIDGWAGTAGASGTAGQIFFGNAAGTLTPTQLAQINFNGYGLGATILGNGELVPLATAANVGIYDSYITIGGTNYFMGASGPIPATGFSTTAPTFSSGLGTIYAGSTATITASQISVFKSNGAMQGDVSGGKVYYAIYQGSTQPPFSSFSVALNCFGFGSQGTAISGYIPQVWNSSCSTTPPNIFSALSQGSYNLAVFIAATAKNNTAMGCYENVFSGTTLVAPFNIGPSISGLAPTSGYTGSTIQINGSGFTNVTAVTIGGVPASSFSVNGAFTQITATVGDAAGGATVTVTNNAITSTFTGFTYLGYLSQLIGNYSDPTKWLGGVYAPADGYPVTIASTITLDKDAAPSKVTINSTFTFTASDASPRTLSITASASGTTLANSGTWANGAGGSTVFFTAPSASTGTIIHAVSGTVAFNNVTVGRSGGTAVVGLNFGAAGTVNNNYMINSGGYTDTNGPIYGGSSTLIYNTGSTYVITASTVEWTAVKIPMHVQVGTAAISNSQLSFGTVSAVYQCNGNLTVGVAGGSGYGMTLSTNAAMGLKIKGDYTIENASVTNNGRGIEFNGNTVQTITNNNTGQVFFDILVINNVGASVKINNSPATGVTINYTTGNVLQILNTGTLDLNGRVLTMNNAGGNIQVNGVGRTVTSGVTGGILAIYGSKTVTNTGSGTLNIGVTGATSSFTTLQLNSSLDFGASLTYIYGTLEMKNNGFVNTNAPTYQSGSLLRYNSGNTWGRALEWYTASGPGYPYNVTVASGTTLDPSNFGVYISQVFNMAGDLTINGNLYMDVTSFNMLVTLNVGGDIIINGSFSASGLAGGDVALQGDWTNNGTWTHHNRLVSWFGSVATSIIGGSNNTQFGYLTFNKTSGGLTLNKNISIVNTLTMTKGVVTMGNNNVTLLTGATLSGTASVTNMMVTNGAGQFIWTLPVIGSSTAYVFPVGDATPNYTPVTLTFLTNSAAGTLGVNVVNTTHPNMGTPSAYLQRYWTFGHNTLANYTFTGTFKYVAGDLTGSAANIQLSAWSGSAWLPYYGSSAAANTLTQTATLDQTIAPLTGDYTGRTATPTAYNVTGGTNCGTTTVGVASSQIGVSYRLYLNAVATGSPVVSAATGSAINFGAQTAAGTYTVIATDVNGNTTQMNGTAVVNPLPTVTITPPSASLCSYEILPMTASGADTYEWSPATGLDATTGASVNATISATTIYTITGVSALGCSGTATQVLTLKPLPSLNVTPANAVCLGTTTVVLTASGANSYTWAPNTDISATTGAAVTVQISNLTFYTVTGTGANGCTGDVVVPVATVATGGTIAPTYSIICSGTTKALTVTGTAGHDYQWQMSGDNINWSDVAGATNTSYTTSGANGTTKKYYRLVAQSDACWNVASTTAVVEVSSPTITVNVTATTDNSVTLDWTPIGSGNYTINYSGPTSGSIPNVTPPKVVTGLTANGTYSFTITQTGLAGCPASGTVSGVTTLCAQATAVNAIAPGSSLISVSWTGPTANYRVYYRPLFSATSYAVKDVTNATSTTITKYGSNNISGSTTYEIYVCRLDCPTTGVTGQPSSKVYVTTPPSVACATPVIDSVKSICPVQIEVWVHGSASNQYQIYLQRLTPTVQAVNSYPITGGHFSINIGSAGQTYLIAAASKCGTALSTLTIWPGNLTVKPVCAGVSNLLLSNPVCKGFTASWNMDQCLSNTASYYQLYIRQVGTVTWNSYPIPAISGSVGPYQKVNWLGKGRTYEVYVKAVYNCNGFVSYGQSSLIQTISTLSAGCREEDEVMTEETPVAQQLSNSGDEFITLYPNPNSGQFAIDISRVSSGQSDVRVEVMNMLGQVVTTHLTGIDGGHLNEFITLPANAAAGNYFVLVTVGANTYTTKMNLSR